MAFVAGSDFKLLPESSSGFLDEGDCGMQYDEEKQVLQKKSIYSKWPSLSFGSQHAMGIVIMLQRPQIKEATLVHDITLATISTNLRKKIKEIWASSVGDPVKLKCERKRYGVRDIECIKTRFGSGVNTCSGVQKCEKCNYFYPNRPQHLIENNKLSLLNNKIFCKLHS